MSVAALFVMCRVTCLTGCLDGGGGGASGEEK
jgi:hypothetical protein